MNRRARCLKCGKAKFTEDEAFDLIVRKNRKRSEKKVPIRYYYSPKCGTFHVTSKPYRETGRQPHEQ